VIKNQESYPQKKIEGGEKSVIFLRVPVLFGGKKAGEAKKSRLRKPRRLLISLLQLIPHQEKSWIRWLFW
jgi:hypothetical protein